MARNSSSLDAPFTNSIEAVVGPYTQTYGKPHLLSLPIEIRSQIWREAAEAMARHDGRSAWYKNPQNQYWGLPLTCRQVHAEIHEHWYLKIVPWNKMQYFLQIPKNPRTIKKFRSLSINVDLEAAPGYFTGLAAFLYNAGPYLRELRLSFSGTDLYGTPVYPHGCGNLLREASERKLPIDGQRYEHLRPLWCEIARLDRLETLVISNANLQLFDPMLLRDKPYLRNLHVSVDPRVTTHLHRGAQSLGFLLTGGLSINDFPPIKVLHISANSMLTSSVLVTNVAPTLQHLSWIVPDGSLQSSGSRASFYERTAHMMAALGGRGVQLQTLRICIAGAGLHDDNFRQDSFLGALPANLGSLGTLKHLELHFNNETFFFGQRVFENLPNSLEHLYTSDSAFNPSEITHVIWDRYMTKTDHPSGPPPKLFALKRTPRGPRTPQAQGRVRSNAQISLSTAMVRMVESDNDGPWLINPVNFGYHNEKTLKNDRSMAPHMEPKFISRHRSLVEDGFDPGCRDHRAHVSAYHRDQTPWNLVGEHYGRQDYIPLDTGRLRFIHFEYDTEFCEVDIEDHMSRLHLMLMINGRLLDRERNQHLSRSVGRHHIPPRCSKDDDEHVDDEGPFRSTNEQYSIMLHSIYEVETTHPRLVSKIESEFNWTPRHSEHHAGYFGKEREAALVFAKERVAKIDQMKKYTYPAVQDVVMNDKCHWMSPEAKVTNVEDDCLQNSMKNLMLN